MGDTLEKYPEASAGTEFDHMDNLGHPTDVKVCNISAVGTALVPIMLSGAIQGVGDDL